MRKRRRHAAFTDEKGNEKLRKTYFFVLAVAVIVAAMIAVSYVL